MYIPTYMDLSVIMGMIHYNDQLVLLAWLSTTDYGAE